MNPLEEEQNGRPAAMPNRSGASDLSLDDPRVTQALHEYQAACRAGQRPERQHFLASHPDIAEALAECLDGLEFLQAAAPALRESASNPLVPADAFQPEGPLGDFRIVREIGRGGMGIVYEAVQISLGRRVALKVLPFAAALDPKQLQRFKTEAQAAAHLHHTHIVPVFGVGCERGIHYYAMQLIAGQTLAALIQDLRTRGADRRKDEGRSTNDERMTNAKTHERFRASWPHEPCRRTGGSRRDGAANARCAAAGPFADGPDWGTQPAGSVPRVPGCPHRLTGWARAGCSDRH